MGSKNVLLLFFILLFVGLPSVHAQAGLYVSQHNITYRLFDSHYLVEEKIVFENTGDYVFTVQRWVNLERGNATDFEVEGIAEKNVIIYDQDFPAVVRFYLEVNKGAAKEVTFRYSRTDGLGELDHIKTYTAETLGRYSWDTESATIKFIAPDGYQFGDIIPVVPKKIVDGREEISINLIMPEHRIFLTYGLPVEISYGKFEELSFAKMDVARGKVADARSNLEKANATIENSLTYGANLSESLDLYNHSLLLLNASEEEMVLAEDYFASSSLAFYDAYSHAITAESLAKEVSEKATEAEQKANFEVQKSLNEKILALTSIMTPGPTKTSLPVTTAPPTTSPPTTPPATMPVTTTPPPQVSTEAPKAESSSLPRVPRSVFLLLVVALVAIGIFLAKKKKPSGRRGEVGDFRVISDLKRKKFTGFDEQVHKVKKEVELASEIRKLRRERDILESSIHRLEEEKMAGRLGDDEFYQKKQRLDESLRDVNSKIEPLVTKLNEIKKVKG